MGIKVEFNPDLALRNIKRFKEGKRRLEECIPENLKANEVYKFLKEGQRNYWLEGEVPLVETKGRGRLSRPLASVTILDVTHFVEDDFVYTSGRYLVNEVFDPKDSTIHFEGYTRRKT